MRGFAVMGSCPSSLVEGLLFFVSTTCARNMSFWMFLLKTDKPISKGLVEPWVSVKDEETFGAGAVVGMANYSHTLHLRFFSFCFSSVFNSEQ